MKKNNFIFIPKVCFEPPWVSIWTKRVTRSEHIHALYVVIVIVKEELIVCVCDKHGEWMRESEKGGGKREIRDKRKWKGEKERGIEQKREEVKIM